MRRVIIVVIVSLILICLSSLASRQAVKINYKPNNLLRLHITANSNSLTDQLIKRKVRAAVLAASQDLFTEITNISQAKQKISYNLDYLTKVVQQRVYELGANYQVQLKLEKTEFPRRSYGNLTLPSAKYQALNVILGRGTGENWWCVLFPPLCLVNSEQKEINPKQLAFKLKQAQNNDQLPVEFKFKLVEYLQENPELAKLKGKLGHIFWPKAH